MKNVSCDGVPVFCAFDELVEISEIQKHPRNPNVHPDSQIDLLAKIINEQGFRAPITISKRSGYITRGHGRLEAAKKLGLEHVPIDYQEYADEGSELADMLADNRIAELSYRDDGMLKDILDDLQEMDFDVLLSGYELEEPIDFDGDGTDDTYTPKVDVPQYEVQGEKPELSELVHEDKCAELIEEIEAAEIDEEVKAFLIKAAERHRAFNYRKIAEYYACASVEVQRLMEKSALVIIDFEDAIKNGYVKLTKTFEEMLAEEEDA